MFESLNKKRTIREGINTEEMEFKPISEFIGKVVKVDGFFFTEGNYGTQVVVVGNGCKINVPKRYADEFKKIEDDYKMLKAVLEGHLALTNITEIETKQGDTVVFDFADC